MEPMKATSVNSCAEELFVQLFCEASGPEKTENLQVQYPCVDIYGRHRYIDFALESPESKIAIEIDGETYALCMISNFVLADRVQPMAGMSISVGAEIQKTGKNCLKRKA